MDFYTNGYIWSCPRLARSSAAAAAAVDVAKTEMFPNVDRNGKLCDAKFTANLLAKPSTSIRGECYRYLSLCLPLTPFFTSNSTCYN